ncbi:MAG TPA: DedA family protein [Roseiflexaceae bacterium]|nr:DedA family protein [Roseiflexaceae bacterium]
MLGLVTRHSLIAICLAVFLEELGIPMPIPTDILIVFAGVAAGQSLSRLALWFVLLSLASAIGSTGLYLAVRLGGRPLVERFGRYVHLGPEQLTRAERLLNRFGWAGIAFGRAIPGLRYVTVIACGLLRVSYFRYLTAHLVGSSVYIAIFLVLGSIFGPVIAEQLHAPEQALRLLWELALAIGLPLLFGWLCIRGHARQVAAPSRRRQLGALVLASFAGTTAMAAAWAGAATLTDLLGAPRSLDVTHMLANWLLDRGLRTSGAGAHMLVYAALLLLCVGVGVIYYELFQPRSGSNGATLPRQALGLGLLGGSLVACAFTLALLFGRVRPLERWWQAGGSLLLLAIAVGVVCYTLTTVYGRSLAIAVLPSFSRGRPMLVARRRPKLPADDTVAVVGTNGRGDIGLPSETASCLPEVEEVSELAGPDK